MRLRMLPLAVLLLGIAGCGGATKAREATPLQEAERATNEAVKAEESPASKKSEACSEWTNATIAWLGQVARAVEPHGETAALTRADEDSYRVEAASKKVASVVPGTTEAVARFVAALARVRMTEGEQQGLNALAEASAAEAPIKATCFPAQE